MVPGIPTKLLRMPGPSFSGLPNPILNTHSTHTISTSENPVKAMSIVLTAHLRCTIPPYKIAIPGMLINPTRVAATSCQALSPALSHGG